MNIDQADDDLVRNNLVVAVREELTARRNFLKEGAQGEISPEIYESWLRAVQQLNLARIGLETQLSDDVVVTSEGRILIGSSAKTFKISQKRL